MMKNHKETPGFAWFWEALDLYLERHKLKQTQQRKIIVDFFLRINSHVDAEELHRRIRAEGHDIGLATIYRTLNLLMDAGIVEERSFQDGRSVFEVASPDGHHDHLVCTECGLVIEFENEGIEEMQRAVAKQYSINLKTHRLDLFGTCMDEKSCLERREKKIRG
ncbi:MAG: Fur family transcriptional regulator [Proteobacteria bacterium]|jgi:Fur family ferric uptake transcriptional regulator|nr:Fur family transcriptional regulator [Pseudomonadota bacterium]